MSITGYQSKGFIGAGIIMFDRFDANGNPTGERDLGESPEFVINPMKITKKDVIGHRPENFGDLVEDTVTGKPQDFKFSLRDRANKKNLALAFFGEDSVADQVAGAVTAEAITARLDLEVKLAKMKLDAATPPEVVAPTPAIWVTLTAYALGVFVSKVAGNAYRYECTAAGTSGAGEPVWPTVPGQTVVDGTVTWTCRKVTFEEDVDYEIDYTYGMLKALEAGDIPDAQALLVDYSILAYTGYRIQASTLTKIEGLIRVKGKNVATGSGSPYMVRIFKASLIPTGAVAFIMEDYDKLEITGNIMATDDGTWEYIGVE